MNFLSLLNQRNFCTFNRELAHKIGLHETIFLHALVAKYEQCRHSLEYFDNESYFYYLVEDAQEDTTLGEKSQSSVIKNLEEMGICKKINKGLPCKRYFKINFENLGKLFQDEIIFTKSSQSAELDPPNGRNCILPTGGTHHIYKNNNKNKPLLSPVPKGPPTSQEATDLAYHLLKRRKELFPKMLDPNIVDWAKQIGLMNERDKRSWEDIRKAIDFAMDDAFWCKNILSAEKLRKQYDKLFAKMTPVQNIGAFTENNRNTAIEIKNYLNTKNRGNKLQIFKNKCFLVDKNEDVFYNMNPDIFEKILIESLGLKKNEQ